MPAPAPSGPRKRLDVTLARAGAAGRGHRGRRARPAQGPHQEQPDHAAGIELRPQLGRSPATGITWAACGRWTKSSRLVDGLSVREHQRLSGRASAAAISPSSRSAPSRWRCPLEFRKHALRQRPGDRRRVQRRGAFDGAGLLRQDRRPRRDRRRRRREPFPRTHGVQGHAHALGRRREPRVRRDGRPLQRLHQRGEHGLLRGRAAGVSGPAPSSCWPTSSGPSLREEDFDTEKQVILEEIRMYEDQPPFGADDKCRAAALRRAPAGPQRAGHGRRASADLPVEAMREYFERRYSPGNIVLAGAGPDRLRRAWWHAAERCCGGWSRRSPRRERRAGRAARAAFSACTRRRPRSNTCCSWPPGPPPTDADRYAAKLLATVLGDDSGSRLYWELVDPGLAEHASLSHREYQGAGVFMTYMSCEPEHAAGNLQQHRRHLSPRPKPRASPRPSWSRPRARSARASCSAASGRAGGCSPWAATGSSGASIAR